MLTIDFKVICPKFYINVTIKSIKKKSCQVSPKKANFVEKEFYKLLKSGVILETKFPG